MLSRHSVTQKQQREEEGLLTPFFSCITSALDFEVDSPRRSKMRGLRGREGPNIPGLDTVARYARSLHSGEDHTANAAVDIAAGVPEGIFCAGGTVMNNGFETSYQSGVCIIWLFSGNVLSTSVKYVGFILLTFSLGIALEGIRFLRARALREKSPMVFVEKLSPSNKDLLLAIMYGAQMVLAYFLMLLVMTYEPFFFAAVVFGLTAGNYIFSRIDNRRKAVLDSNCDCVGTCEHKVTTAAEDSVSGSTSISQSPTNSTPNKTLQLEGQTSATPCCGG